MSRVFSFAPPKPVYQLLRFILLTHSNVSLLTCFAPVFIFYSHKKPTIQADFISFFGAYTQISNRVFPTVQKCNVRFKLILITQQKAEYYCSLLEDGELRRGCQFQTQYHIACLGNWNSVYNFVAVTWNLKDYNRKTLTKRIKPLPFTHPSVFNPNAILDFHKLLS